MFEKAFWGKAGLRNKENFTKEDMEAWKYAFSQPGEFLSHCARIGVVIGTCIRLKIYGENR